MLRSLTRIQRDAGVLANAPIVGSLQGSLLFSSNITPSALGGDETVMGMIGTSVTKKLWLKRLTKNKDRLKHLPLPALNAKPPQPITVTYPFSSDRFLQEQYRNPWNQVRVGKLLEDLDSLAGNIAFQHCDDERTDTQLPLLVTASVDAIHLRRRLDLHQDVQVSGQVVWTGKSAMDIRMQLNQEHFKGEPSLVALFTFVARHPLTKKSTQLNALKTQTAEEKQQFEERQAVADDRKAARNVSASAQPNGTNAKQKWAEQLLGEARAMIDMPSLTSGNAMLMRDTAMQNTFVCQPQQRNIHGRVFGGFIMRRAYELAFATAYMFAGQRPTFKEVDEVTFMRPVNVGDLLKFRSCIIHTAASASRPNKATIYAEVVASVAQPEQVASNMSNMLTFVFEVSQDHVADADSRKGSSAASPRTVKRVLPATNEEAQKIYQFFPGEGG
ncbi:hypothetical protein WJX82_004111 [Trebouxia sp. C0006]